MEHTHILCRTLIIIVLLILSYPPFAQEFSNKYGKVTNDELAMTTYQADTTANAVVIFKKGSTSYDYVNNDFRVINEVEVKIKVLKQDGTEYANVSIPYYQNEKYTLRKEVVSGIDASAYNLEDGKQARTKMKKEYIFRERLNDNYMQVKFSIPAVQVGTVIEYKYKLQSDYYYSLDSWEVQQEIPVIYNNYELTIPEYFKFNLDHRGGQTLDVKETAVTQSLSVIYERTTHTVQCNSRKLSFTGTDIPALKADSYVLYPDDFKSKINFELQGLDFPGSGYRSLTTSWEKIDELLLDDDDFGKLLKMRNPFRDEMKNVSLEGLSINEKISTLYAFLKQRISWNEEYAISGSGWRKAIKDGTANNAILNFILISMLREANIPAHPVVMSRRDRGIIPYAHPSINKLNTFIVGIENSDSTMVYLDGSVQYGFINTLPVLLLPDRARVVKEGKRSHWIEPQKMDKSSTRTIIHAKISAEGEIEGMRQTSLIGQYASALRRTFKAAKDSLDFIEKKESDSHIKLSSYQSAGINEFSPIVSENYTFTKSVDRSGDYMYINPLIFPVLKENPFKQETRTLPVEFPFAQSIRISSTLILPEGYVVDELPKPAMVSLPDNKGAYRYVIQQTANNTILMNYSFNLTDVLYAATDYEYLKKFFEMVAEKNNEMIVLKKANI